MATVDVNGTRLHYDEHGSGPPVLLVHGAGDYGAIFEQTVAELGPGFRSIAYDRRGYARSEGPPASGLGEHVEDAAALLRTLGATPATVAATSAGGVVALGLALAHPRLVGALVLAEPTYQPAFALTASALRAFAAMYARWWLLRDAEGAALGVYRWITSYRGGGNQFDSLPEEARRAGAEHARAALREITQLLKPWPSTRAVGSISCPATVAVGDLGRPFFHRTSARACRALPAPRVVPIAGSAHLLAVDRPDALAEAIAATTAHAAGGVR